MGARRFLGCAIAALAACSGPERPDPELLQVVPDTGTTDAPTEVVISGERFRVEPVFSLDDSSDSELSAVFSATLDDVQLLDVTLTGETSLAATVPAGMAPGEYTLTVTDPVGGTAVLPAAFTVVDSTVEDRTDPWDEPFTISDPVLIAGLNSFLNDQECYLSPDGLTLWFGSMRLGGEGATDLYVATRDTTDNPFSSLSRNSSLSTIADEGRVSMAEGQLLAAYHTNRSGGEGLHDIWLVTRDSTDDDFLHASAVPAGAANSAGEEFDPWLSRDGKRLYFVSDEAGGDSGLFVSTRASVDDPFPAPVALGLNTTDIEDNPELSADEKFIVFASDRPGGPGRINLWYATRDDVSSEFGEPTLLPVLNTDSDDTELCLSDDGDIVFSSDRPGGVGSRDLYTARIVPLP